MNNDQKLVDIAFELVAIIFEYHTHFETKTQEQRMQWVAEQLEKCGFKTKPMGVSWGVLV